MNSMHPFTPLFRLKARVNGLSFRGSQMEFNEAHSISTYSVWKKKSIEQTKTLKLYADKILPRFHFKNQKYAENFIIIKSILTLIRLY